MGKEIQQADLRHLAFVAVIALRKQSLQREYEQLQNILKFGKGTEIVKAMKQMREIQLQIKQLDEQLSGK